MSDTRGKTPHDAPMTHVEVKKEGKTWHWEHKNCPLFPNEDVHKGDTRTGTYEDALKNAITHVEVHGG